MMSMNKGQRRDALRNLWRTARMLLVLGKAVLTGQAISMNVELRGNILLNHGIEKFGGQLAGDLMEKEPAEDENGPFTFLAARMGGVEILQIDDESAPEEEAE